MAYSLGVASAQLGRLEEARTWLDRAATSGFPCYPWYVRDKLLEHKQYIKENGEDLPEILNWRWRTKSRVKRSAKRIAAVSSSSRRD